MSAESFENQNKKPAPVALFVYNRPWHTQQTIDSLKRNLLAGETTLYVFSDGPKTPSQGEKVNEVRRYIRSIEGFKKVEIFESQANKGLANSIITGVSWVLERYNTIIVLEDDMITSPYFLSYMNNALRLYESKDEVISIHGYIYPIQEPLPKTFFIKGADCWGWATWKRGWTLFQSDGSKLMEQLKRRNLTYEFDFFGTYPYTRMLAKQIAGKNDSWAIRWYAAAFLQNKLTLYPGKSYVRNIGNDTSGTHSWDNERFDQQQLADKVDLDYLEPQESIDAKKIISNYFKSSSPSFLMRVLSRVRFVIR